MRLSKRRSGPPADSFPAWELHAVADESEGTSGPRSTIGCVACARRSSVPQVVLRRAEQALRPGDEQRPGMIYRKSPARRMAGASPPHAPNDYARKLANGFSDAPDIRNPRKGLTCRRKAGLRLIFLRGPTD